MFEYIFKTEKSEPGSSTYRETVTVFLNVARFTKRDEGDTEESLSFEDFRNWCTLLPSVRKFLGSLLILPDHVRPGSQVPRLLSEENINSNLILLNEVYAWHIGGILPHEELEEWKLLYHSAVNGLSFNTFVGNISSDEGPTVFIIKDKDGYIYMDVMLPSRGRDMAISMCAVNFGSESIPNGIGFGGKVNHFGLFLSANFDQRHTFPCTTFGSPCLSETSRICPEVIECLGVVRKAADEEKQDSAKGTILERFKEDRHMLNMGGLANSSE